MKTTGEDIFKALENADEHYIEECRQSGSGIKIKTIWTKWAAVAACGVFAAATGRCFRCSDGCYDVCRQVGQRDKSKFGIGK